jgi:uncharacterized protein with PIN domain
MIARVLTAIGRGIEHLGASIERHGRNLRYLGQHWKPAAFHCPDCNRRVFEFQERSIVSYYTGGQSIRRCRKCDEVPF